MSIKSFQFNQQTLGLLLSMLSTVVNVEKIEKALSTDTENVSRWCILNDMALSLPKSSCMIVSTRQKLSREGHDVSLDIKINDIVIPYVSSAKLLGVHFDQTLSWDQHVVNIQKKINSNLYLLKQIKEFLPLDARKLFYNCYILPHLDYCSVIWGNCSQTNMYKLVKLQKRAARLILDKDFSTRSSDLFLELGWMPLEDRITFQRGIQVYKCLNDRNTQGLGTLFQYGNNVHVHNTRSSADNNLYIAHNHLKSFTHTGATTWNKIPPSVRNSESLPSFKRNYLNTFFTQ